MPFSRANRRLTILSIVTCFLGILVAVLYGMGHAEAVKAVLLVFGPVAVIWNNERLASIQRHDLKGPMFQAEVSAKAAASVTVEAFEKLQTELTAIKKGLNGELDARIEKTVDKALDAALDKRMDALATKIADRLTAPTPKVRT